MTDITRQFWENMHLIDGTRFPDGVKAVMANLGLELRD